MHKEFVDKVIKIIQTDENVLGLAVAGSWITNEIDEFSDLDLVLVTKEKIAPNQDKMIDFASKLGNLLNAFTGEHVGEKRLLICLFDNPLIHVDIKFLIPEEFYSRIENPIIIWERNNILSKIIGQTTYQFPYPDYQWIEDRFWIWVHYATLKIGRGELFEALDFLSFLRVNVISSLLQIKNEHLPRALRKVEFNLPSEDLTKLKSTIANYEKKSIIESLKNLIEIYKELQKNLFDNTITLQKQTEKRSIEYLKEIELLANSN